MNGVRSADSRPRARSRARRAFASLATFLVAASLTTCKLDDLLTPGTVGSLASTTSEVADTAFAGSTATTQYDVDLQVNGVDERMRFVVSAEHGSGWIELQGETGVAPGTFSVTVNPTGLAAGDHVDTLRFTSEGPDAPVLRIPVRLTLMPCAVTDLGALPTTVAGQLTTADCASPRFADRFAKRYRFAATVNDSVTFRLESSAFAPSLAVFPEGSTTALIATNSCPVAANAACARYVRIPATGNYIFEATSVAARATGAYDVTMGSPRAANAPTALVQTTNATPPVPIDVGGALAATTLRLGATLSDPDLDSTRLELEVRATGIAFTGVPTASGPLGLGASTLTVAGLADVTGYKWRARAVDVTGRASAWVEFGANAPDAVDFAIAIPDAPTAPASMTQRKSDGTTPIAAAGVTDESSVMLGATLNDLDAGDQLRLEVELRPLAQAFTNTATSTSVAVGPGNTATVTVAGLVDGVSYKWQARTVDQTARASAWTPFVPSGAAFRTAFPPTQLAFTSSPTTVVAGVAIAPAVTVAARDGAGATLTSYTGPITVSLAANPDSATLGGTLTVNAVAGIATFSDLTLNRVGTQFTLRANVGALSTTTAAFSVTPAAAAALVVTTSPASATAGTTLAPATVVRARDAFGNAATAYTGNVTVALATNAPGATLAGTTTVAAVGGVATFSDLSVARAATGLTIVASAPGLTGGAGTAFNITPGIAAQLHVTTEPSAAARSGQALLQQPAVAVEDAFGNRVNANGVVITASVATGPGATLAGATATTNATGLAQFTGLTLTGTGGAYTLAFNGGSLAADTSTAITLGAGGLSRIGISVQPSATVVSGQVFTTPARVRLQDASGNDVAQAGVPISVAISSGSGVLTGTSPVLTDATGEAEFDDLVITGVVGVRQLSFASPGLGFVTSGNVTVTAGAASSIQLVAGTGQNAVAGANVTTPPSVRVRDASGNVVAGAPVTFAVTGGAGTVLPATPVLTDANGLATATSWTLGTTAGLNLVNATSPGLVGSPVQFTANGIAGAAAQLAMFGGDNLTGPVATTLGTPHEVRVTDANGNAVAGVTVNWSAATGGGSINPSVSVTGTDGRASATRTLGGGAGPQTSTASVVLAGGPASVTFNVTATVGGATQLTLVGGDQQADSVGSTLATPLSVLVRDANNNPVPNVLISWSVIDGGGSVQPSTSFTNASGIATTSWTLGATTTPTDSTQFVRASGVGSPVNFIATARPGGVSAAQTNVAVVPSSVPASRTAPATVTVTARDRFGNVIPGRTVTIAAAGVGNTIEQPVAPTSAVGVATGAVGATSAGARTIVATVDGIVAEQQPTLTVVAAPAASLLFLTTPPTAVAGTAFSPVLSVGVADSLGNRNFTFGGNVTIGIAVNPSTGTLAGTVTRTAVAGIANFAGLSLDRAGAGYTLIATSPGLGSATSGTIDVSSGGISAARTLVAADLATIVAGRDTATVTVTVRDANDNPVAGASVTLAATGIGNAIIQPVGVTDANGVITGRFSSTVTGARSISASVNGGGAGTVNVTATAAVNVAPADVSPTLSAVEAVPATIVAGGASTTVTVTVRDLFGNAIPGATVILAASGTGNAISQPGSPTAASGVTSGSVASTVSGVKTVTATANGVAITAGATLTVQPGAVSASSSTIVLGASTIIAGGAATAITVTARDANGNPIPGQAVVLAVTGTGNTLTQPAGVTDANGVATGSIASTVTGSKTVSATIGGTAVTPSQVLTVAPGAISETLSTVELATTTTSAGAPPVTITVTVRDANGNPVPGQAVVLAATGAGNTLTQPTAFTNALGVATGSLSSTTAGAKVVSATAGGVGLTQAPTLTVGAGTVSPVTSTIVAVPDTISADGGSSTVTVTARDASGNPVAGATVTIGASGTGNTITQPPAVTDANGVASGALSSTASGLKVVIAAINGSGLPQTDTVVVVPGALSNANSSLVVATDTITAGGTATTITVTARDAHNNALVGAAVVLAATGAGNTLTQPAATTNASGIATGSIASTVTGTKILTATVGGVPLADDDTVVVRAGAVSAALSTVVTSAPTISAAVGQATITVTARDANGNLAPGVTVLLSATGSGNTLTQPGVVTNAAGQASGTFSSTVSEAKTISAIVGGTPVTQTAAITVVPDAVSATQSTVAALPTSITADGGTSTITVTARDANGNPIAGVSVVLSATGTGNTVTQPAALTNASGQATGTLASTVAGLKTVSAAINGVGLTQTVNVTVTPGAVSAATSSLAAAPTTLSADGGASTVTVTARDANGNVIPGLAVSVASTGTGNSITQPGSGTDANGAVTASFSSTAAGIKTLSATIAGVTITQTATVTVNAGVVSGAISTVAAAPGTISADGGSSTITVTARDAHGNPIAGQVVTIAATGTGNTLVQPAAVTDANGVATGSISSTGAGAKAVSATIGATTVSTPAIVTVTAGAVSGATSSLIASPAVITAGGTGATVTVIARDAFGNLVPGLAATIAATGAGNTVTQPAALTSAAGTTTGTVASTVAGLKEISATVGGVAVQLLDTVNVVAAVASLTTSTLVADPATIGASGPTSTITVTARDAFGNLVQGVTVALAATGSGNTLTQPALPTNASGIAVGTLASTVTGDKIVSATLDGGALVMRDTVTVIPGSVSAALTTVAAAPGTLTAGGTGSTITVTARDPSGNPIPGVVVTLAASGTGNTVTQPIVVTDATGAVTGTIASTIAGTKVVTATVAGTVITQTASVVVGPAALSTTTTTVQAAPASIAAGSGTSTITVTARDEFGNAIPGLAVSLAATGTGNTVTQPAAVTSATGVAAGTLASTVTGTKTVTATVGGVTIPQTVDVTVTPGAVSNALATLDAAPDTMTAGSTSTITVTARDANGNVLPGATVVLAASGAGNTVTQPFGVTDANGVATGSLLSTAVGNKIITASVNTTTLLQSDTVTVTPAAVSAATSTVAATPAPIVAGVGSRTITVTVRDAFSNVIPGATVTLAATGTGNTVTQPAAVTDANGVATGSLSSTVSGTKVVTATADGVTITQTVNVSVTSGTVSAANSTIGAAPGSLTAGAGSSTVTITARDANNNPIAGLLVSLSATGTGNSVTQPSVATDANGVATGAYAGTSAGDHVLSASIDGVTITPTATVTIAPAAVSAATSTVLAAPGTITAGGTGSTITVTARDAFNNAVPGLVVSLAASGTGNTVTQPAAVTDANGQATGSLSSTVSGTKVVTATAGGTTLTQTPSVTVNAGAVSAANSTIDAAPGTLTAGVGSSTVTVTARDANNNPIPGLLVSISATGAGNTVTQPGATTDANGVATGSYASTSAGAHTLSASIDGVTITPTATVTVSPAAVSAATSTVQSAPASITAGGTGSTITVTARDAFNNAVPGLAITIAATGTGNTVTQPAAVTDANGQATGTVASTVTGVKSVSASAGATAITQTTNVTVTPAAISAALSTLTASPDTISADGGSTTLTVTARDLHGNLVPGALVILASASPGASVQQPSGATDANGVATGSASSTVSGDKVITVTIGGVAITQTAALHVTAGALSAGASDVSASLTALTAGAGTSTITVIARDAHNNPVPGATVVLSAPGTGNTIVQPAAVTDAAGTTTGTFSSTSRGAKVITAMIDGIAANETAVITISPAAPDGAHTGLTLSDGVIAAAVGTTTVTVVARDEFDNPVPGATVVIAASGTGNTVTQPAAVTDANGATTGTVSSTVTGSKTISGTVNGTAITQTRTLTVIPDAISSAQSSLTLSTGSIVAGGAGTTVTVTARDANGNAVSGAAVVISATASGNTITQPAATTDANGVATGTVAATLTGARTVSATINGIAVTQTQALTVTPGAVSAATSTVDAAPASISADGGSSTITVTARDANGNVIPGATVVLAATGSGNSLVQPAAVTDANGVATGSLSSTGAAAKTVTATIDAVAITDDATVTVTPGAISAATTSVAAVPASIAAGGGGSTITITVRDQHANPVPGVSVTLAATGTGNTLTQPSAVTDANGATIGSLSSLVAGAKVVSADAGGVAVTQTATVTVTAGAVSGANSSLVSDQSTLSADGGSATITVTVRDANNNPVPGATVVLSATGTGNSITQPAAVTDANGVAAGTYAGTGAGLHTVSATADGTAVTQTADITITAGAVSPTVSTIGANAASIVAATGVATITVTARDQHGNGVAGRTVAIAVTGTGNSVTQPAAVTDANGVATASFSSTVAEAKTVSATIDGDPMTATVAVPVTPGAVSAATSTVDAAPASISADGGTSTITVTARDASNNPIAGVAVTLSATGANNTLGQPAAVTDANGVATGTIASTASGAKVVSAEIAGVAITDDATVTVTPGAVSLAVSTIGTNAASIAAGTGVATITVTARDQHGNGVPGRTVLITVSGTGNSIAQPAAVTDASGIATATFSSTLAEAKTVGASIDGNTITPTTAVTVTPGAVSAANSSVDAAPASISADGGTSTITVTARDANNNVIPGVAVVLAATGSGNTLGQPAAVTDVNGVATGTLSSTGSGAKDVSAQVAGVAITDLATVTVTAGAVSPTVSTIGTNAATITAGTGTATITVTARDQHGNPVAGRTVEIAVSGTGNSVTQPAAVTNAAGVATATFSSTVAQAKTVGATIDGNAITPTTAVTVTPGAPSASLSTIVAAPNSIDTDAGSSTVTVTARDDHGNPIPGIAVFLAVTGSGNSLTQPAALTDANGVATGSLSSTIVGQKVLTASVAGDLIDAADTVTVTPGVAAELVVTGSPTNVIAGDAVSPAIVIQARDQHGNLATGFTGNVTLAIETGTGTAGAAFTGSTTATVAAVAGVATFNDIRIDSAGTGYRLRASATGVTDTLTIDFNVTPGAVSVAMSGITVSAASVQVGNTVTFTLTARDALGNRILTGGETVVFSLDADGTAAGSFGSVTDHGDGTYTVVFTGDTDGTARTILATIGGVAVTRAPAPTITVDP